MRLLVICLLAGCAADAEVAENREPDVPPRGHAALRTWLAEGRYQTWACEDAPHPARPPGAHGANRICSNPALSASSEGAYPVGAASVKELVRDGAVTGYAVGTKLATGDWYWYEAYGDSVIADGTDKPLCANCHAGAPRDFVFTHVR